MVTVSGNTGSVPLIGSTVGRIHWSEKGSSNLRSDAKSDGHCVRFETDRTPDGVEGHPYPLAVL